MKFSQFKEEQKALGKVNGIFSLIAYIITYKTKETLSILALVLIAWIATMILDPSLAVSIKYKLVGWIK
jgi:hypothetical protein